MTAVSTIVVFAILMQWRGRCEACAGDKCGATKSAIALIDLPLTRLSPHRNVFSARTEQKRGLRYG
jgi:hypothetical protein